MPKIEHFPIYPGMTKPEYETVKRALCMYARHCDDCLQALHLPDSDMARETIGNRRDDARRLINRFTQPR